MAPLVYEHVSEVFTALGEKGVSAEQVARAVLGEVRSYQVSDAALGPHLADQWALPLALAAWQRRGTATYTCTELTPHAKTTFEVIQRFLPVSFSAVEAGHGWTVQVRQSAGVS